MNCVNHPEESASAFCRTCGKALCDLCQRPALGTVFCQEHVAGFSPPPPPPRPDAGSPWTASAAYAPPSVENFASSPGLAFFLGFIPGVGAVYNGQYAKGLIHAVIFGLMVSITSSGAAPGMEPLIGISMAAFIFYMAFEAYHTAIRRQRGEAVDEFSSILPMHKRSGAQGLPIGPIVMIVLGVIFLMSTLEIVLMRDLLRFWPVFLIGLGGYLLWVRVTGKEVGVSGND
ncbi:MAG: hypothetical protein H7039_18535 [Bryobacteraceae bacterium]|nr:hypothetical protein [Bryobacteraceae bacterium]